jgi:polysaccharide export outer membrane protein
MEVHAMRRLSAIVVLAVACATVVATAAAQDPDKTAPASTETVDTDDGYRIGVEDVLRIVVWGEPQLSLSVKVRPDGKITLPLANDIEVADRTPDEVRQVVASRLGEFIHEPNVTVIVEEINSFRVYFIGEVKNQGAIQFYRPVRLIQGIAAAGGLTEYSKKSITLLREEYGVEKRYEIDYKRLLAGDTDQENIYLQPGDTLLVK